jgi:predicted DNA-binding protein
MGRGNELMDTAAEIEDLEGLIARLRNPMRNLAGELHEKTTVEDMALAADVIERLRRKVSEYAIESHARISQELGLE